MTPVRTRTNDRGCCYETGGVDPWENIECSHNLLCEANRKTNTVESQSIVSFLSYLHRLDVTLWAEGEQLGFEAPDHVLTKELLEEIKKRKPEILTLLRQTSRENRVSAKSLLNVERPSSIPLSYSQQRLWFLHQLDPDSSAYNLSRTLLLSGRLHVRALQRSLQDLINRHETLRTSFPIEEGHPVQAIKQESQLSWREEDVRELSDAEQESTVEALVQEEGRRPFNLVTGPLLRALLVQMKEEEHLLLLTMHHIISDGWSFGVLSRELCELYTAYLTQQPATLPDLPIQYADFSVWQRDRLQGAVLEEQLNYWGRQLADLVPLPLPTDRPRPSVQTFSGASHGQRISHDVTEQLGKISRQVDGTLANVLLSAFMILLSKYTGQTDIAVGSPIANRTRKEIEGLIGFFVNSLVMRVDLSGDPSFRTVVNQVKTTSLEAYDHQDLPFERLVEALQPDRDPSRNPLFQVMFAVQNAPFEGFTLPGLTVTPFASKIVQTRFDLECYIREIENGLTLLFVYNTDLFEEATIKQMGRHFHRLLEGVVRNPDQELSKLSLLDRHERHKHLVEWNNTATAYPQERTITDLFAEQVAVRPEAVAVVEGPNQLTYSQLNERATHCAHMLRAHGVGPEVCVGVCLERSLELVITILGIVKAGGAYVPVDPQIPPDRGAFMLQDANCKVLVIEEGLRGTIGPGWAGTVVPFDQKTVDLGWHQTTPLEAVTRPDNLAYVMYTSGSTGHPKGITIPHRGVVRLVLDTDYVELTSEDRLAQVAPVAFDAATFEIWGALLNGGQVVVLPKTVVLAPSEFQRAVRQYDISTIFVTTALVNHIAQAVPSTFHGVRQVLFGGEAVDPKWIRVLTENGSPRRFLHVYGPTENTTFSTWHRIETIPDNAPTIPIGRPIANTQGYIVDIRQHPVPKGVYGELLLGGDGLARGYLNRPGLTAEKFIPDSWRGKPGGRLYRTGDLVRSLSTGAIEFKGRRDHQIKLRGHRIELGEIEAKLSQHPDVQAGVVMCREDGPGDKELVAYVVGDQSLVKAQVFRDYLKQRLPSYMVPTVFMRIEAIPLTSNGKVDKRALPAPTEADRTQGVAYVPPSGEIQEQIAEIWQDVLKVEKVGRQDNFFEVGGHSLLATQVVSRLREQFKVEMKLAIFFEVPTVEQLAQSIETLRWTTTGKPVTTSPGMSDREEGTF